MGERVTEPTWAIVRSRARCVFLLVAFVALLSVKSAGAQAIAGTARPVDGDTLELAGQRIRLWGIDAPERVQMCEGALGVYECGRDASAVLAAILRGQNAVCEPRDRDRYGRVVAICSTEAGDIGAAMVRQGWATDYRRYSQGRYAVEQSKAKAEGLGMWSGWFDMPEDWRRRYRVGK